MARNTTDAIRVEPFHSEALYTLIQALSQAGLWEVARSTADAIPYEYRARTLCDLARNFIQANYVDKAVAAFVAAHKASKAILDKDERMYILEVLASTLIQVEIEPYSVELTINFWQQAQTSEELLILFKINPTLLRTHPELEKEFLDSFSWVDAQLVGE